MLKATIRMLQIRLLIVGFLVFIDQLSKYLIRSQGGPARSASLNDAGGFFICNKGIAFGIKLPEAIILCVSIALILFLACLILNFKFKINKLKNLGLIENLKLKIENYGYVKIGIILIISGAVSNILDRLIHGCVIDFIDLKYWPIFNLADAFITIGALLILYSFLKEKQIKAAK